MRNNPNGRRHLAEVTRAKKERLQLSKAIWRLMGEHYSRRELIKIYYLVYEWYEISFLDNPKLSSSDPMDETKMPPLLRDLFKVLYPPREIPEPEDTVDGLL